MNGETNVGILAIEVYFPSTFVQQTDLEEANAVSKGKYTIGLGQDAMAFTGDREDVNSISLTVVQSLLEKYNISKNDIGRLEVGTESLVDKSKSTKTVLMSLFADSGNTDIEGATVINACYGGTAALLNALTWVDSSCWDGRFAIVVAADIAVYADGPARPTGGCGAVAMLIGRNAPLKIDLSTRTTHATHVWDFFKPKMDSEYPEVNGALSQTCYLRALDDCYNRFIEKQKKVHGTDFSIATADTFLFHSPYNKLVQKSFARLIFLDIVANRPGMDTYQEEYSKWIQMPREQTYEDKELEVKLKDVATPLYKTKVAPSCEISKNIGNTYTAAVYMNLANIVSNEGAKLEGKSLVLFSYGSGALATMLEIKCVPCENSIFTLEKIQKNLDASARLTSRERLTPKDLNTALEQREKSHNYVPYKPSFSIDKLFPGTFYLDEISTSYERNYIRKPLDAIQVKDGPLMVEMLLENGILGGEQQDMNEMFNVGMDLSNKSQEDREVEMNTNTLSPRHKLGSKQVLPSPDFNLRRNETQVWASGRPNVRVVVTGVAAALPGRNTAVFAPGVNNIHRILKGENCIEVIPDEVKESMLDKNVVLLKKNKDGSQSKETVVSTDNNVNLCATIGNFNLAMYGVSDSIAGTMDKAVQVAVAAGLEALKDAKIVTGEGENLSGWVLPEHLQETTGVVYATSFPALDAAIEEVSKFFLTKTLKGSDVLTIMSTLKQRLEITMGPLSVDAIHALHAIESLAIEASTIETPLAKYEFDRKFLFRVLVLGNAQLAQIIKARGPNMQTNAACAGLLYGIRNVNEYL